MGHSLSLINSMRLNFDSICNRTVGTIARIILTSLRRQTSSLLYKRAIDEPEARGQWEMVFVISEKLGAEPGEEGDARAVAEDRS